MEATNKQIEDLFNLQEKTFEKLLKEKLQKEWLIKTAMFMDMFHSDSL